MERALRIDLLLHDALRAESNPPAPLPLTPAASNSPLRPHLIHRPLPPLPLLHPRPLIELAVYLQPLTITYSPSEMSETLKSVLDCNYSLEFSASPAPSRDSDTFASPTTGYSPSSPGRALEMSAPSARSWSRWSDQGRISTFTILIVISRCGGELDGAWRSLRWVLELQRYAKVYLRVFAAT